MVEERVFANEAGLVEALAGDITERLSAAAKAQGVASLICTGGSTPGSLYDALRAGDAPWSRLWVTLTDERWLPTDVEGSNERLVRERLLAGHDEARLIPLKTADKTPQQAAAKVEAAVSAMPRPFDVAILGMGPDGHFASLFPGNRALGEGLDPKSPRQVIAVDAPGAYGSAQRLSLTLAAVLSARWIAILIRGDEKLALLRKASGADPLDLPIAAVLDQSAVPVTAYWAP